MTQRPPQPGWFRWSSLLLALGGVLIFVVAFSGLRAGAAPSVERLAPERIYGRLERILEDAAKR